MLRIVASAQRHALTLACLTMLFHCAALSIGGELPTTVPVLCVHPLRAADPREVAEFMRSMVPEGQLVLAGRDLAVFAPPAIQKAVAERIAAHEKGQIDRIKGIVAGMKQPSADNPVPRRSDHSIADAHRVPESPRPIEAPAEVEQTFESQFPDVKMIPVPRGPVRVVHVKELDLFLIRARRGP